MSSSSVGRKLFRKSNDFPNGAVIHKGVKVTVTKTISLGTQQLKQQKLSENEVKF